MRAALIEAAFLAACEDELAAPKPGNVHIFSDGHGMTVADFRVSAAVAAGPLCRPGACLGARILDAVTATRMAVGQNTNLGIVLLAAPLAMAAEHGTNLRPALARVLAGADLSDAELVFRAIALAAPGGLGQVENDVCAAARVTLAVAMAQAAERDRIAHQWTHTFADVFERGLPALAAGTGLSGPVMPALRVYLAFLAELQDSHIRRKFGAEAADTVRREAVPFHLQVTEAVELGTLLPGLLAWDASLKARGLNPGTTADLTVATLFVHRLEAILRAGGVDG